MKTRFAFIGFQHPHIWDLVTRATAHPDIEIVACCEEDAATRDALAASGKVRITHTDYRAMLAEVKIDAVVALTPFFIRFTQDELVDYYAAVARPARTRL